MIRKPAHIGLALFLFLSTSATAFAQTLRATDYDGDGKSDLTTFRPSSGTSYVLKSSGGFSTDQIWIPGAIGTDLPAPGDYDGDGKADAAWALVSPSLMAGVTSVMQQWSDNLPISSGFRNPVRSNIVSPKYHGDEAHSQGIGGDFSISAYNFDQQVWLNIRAIAKNSSTAAATGKWGVHLCVEPWALMDDKHLHLDARRSCPTSSGGW